MKTYNHIAFAVADEDLPKLKDKIAALNLEILPGRDRNAKEGNSLYFYDYDLFFHWKEDEFIMPKNSAGKEIFTTGEVK